MAEKLIFPHLYSTPHRCSQNSLFFIKKDMKKICFLFVMQ